MLSAVALLAGAAAPAAEKGEVQLSVYLGGQNLHVDDRTLVGGERVHRNGLLVGTAAAYRFPRGLLLEVSLLHASHSDFVFANVFRRSFGSHQYAAAVGWQFDNDRWRITPKIGVARSLLTTDGALLLSPEDEEVDDGEIKATVPFAEASVTRRLGEHFAVGAFLRETFEDFGHTRSWGATALYFFD
jgi:hypothetical protein